MRRRRLLITACMSVTIAACSIGRPMPSTETYVVDLPGEIAGSSGHRIPETLRMGNVRVAAPFAGRALVYRFSDVRYASDPYQEFASDPGEMLASQIAEWLDHAGPFRAVAQPGSARPARYVLEVSVAELYGDFRAGRPPTAVLALQFALVDQAGARPRLVYERSISRTVDLPKELPEALVRGYGTALSQMLTQVVSDFEAQFAGRGDDAVAPVGGLVND